MYLSIYGNNKSRSVYQEYISTQVVEIQVTIYNTG